MATPNPDLAGDIPERVIAEGDPGRVDDLLFKINGDPRRMLLHRAYAVMEPGAALRWIDRPNPELGGSVPCDESELIFDRYRAAERLLEALAPGGIG